jgi:hypothetical protein
VRPSLVDAAHVIVVEELAGLEAFLDPLLALLGNLDDVALLEFGDGNIEMLGQPPDIIPADPYIASHPAAQGRTFQAV